MRRFAAVAVAATLLVLPACGSKTDEANRAAGITPSSALALVSVNLSPSIAQKRDLLGIVRKFPDARETVKGEFDDARDRLLGQLLEESGLDYAADVKPWLGKEAALVVLPPPGAGAPPLILAMVQTGDKAKAKAAIEKARASGDFEGAYEIVDDFVVVSDQDDEASNQPALEQITAQSKKTDGALAEATKFTGVIDQLHGDRLVLGWIDAKSSLEVAEDLSGFEGAGFLRGLAQDAGVVAFDLHAEAGAVVFQGAATASGEGTGSVASLTRSLPATTLAALTMFDLGKSAAKALQALAGLGGEDVTAQLEQATGVDLEADVLSWMEGEAVVVVGPPGGDDPFPQFALVVEPTDRAGAEAGLASIRQGLAAQGLALQETQVAGASALVAASPVFGSLQPAMALFPDRFVLASSPAYLEELARAAEPALGDADAYRGVLGSDDEGNLGQFILFLDPVREALERSVLSGDDDRASYDKEVRPNLEPLSALGGSTRRSGGYDVFEIRLTFD